jgi:23S rRNA-/tRNA-specific pseudouridylate synthase
MSTELENIPLHAGVKVLKVCKSGLVALDKPEGVLAHPNGSEDNARALITANYSLEEEAYHIRDGAGGIRRVWLINRLDGPTSGVILLATNEAVAIQAKAHFAQGKVSKAYVAICLGRNVRKLRGIWIDDLVKEGRGPEGVRSLVVRPGLRPRGPVSQAITHFSSGEKGQGALDLIVLNLEPKTGRTHQLRVQCAEHGHPILGDKTYGNFDGNKALGSDRGFKRLFLHAASIELTIQCDGKPAKFLASAPLPAEFTAVMGTTKGPAGDKNSLGKVRL